MAKKTLAELQAELVNLDQASQDVGTAKTTVDSKTQAVQTAQGDLSVANQDLQDKTTAKEQVFSTFEQDLADSFQ